MNDQKSLIHGVTRRQVLQIMAGSTAAAALPMFSQPGVSAFSLQDGTRTFNAAWPYAAPPQGTFNLLRGVASGIDLGYLSDLILVPGAMYLWDEQSYEYMLADESSALSEDGTVFTYKVREGLVWNDGSPVTGQDVYSSWVLQFVMGHRVFDYLDGFSLVDDMTVEFQISTPAPIAEYDLLRMRPVANSVYGEFAVRAEELLAQRDEADEEDIQQLAQEISALTPEQATISGPFTFDYGSITDSQLLLVKNPDGYLADTVQFDNIVVYNGEVAELTPLVLAGEVDYATHGFPVATSLQFESQGIRILRNPTYFGRGLYFGMGKRPEFADQRVRQAFAHALDRDGAAQGLLGESGAGVQYLAGFSDRQVPQWLSKEDLDKLNQYPHDLDAAEALLLDAGWSRDGDRWLKPDGEPAQYDLIYATGSPNDNFVDSLNNFGIEITSVGQDASQVPVMIGQGDFDLAVANWGSTSNPFPTDAFTTALFVNNYLAHEPNRGMDFPLQQETDIVGPIDFEEAVVASGRGTTAEDLAANVTTVALAFNELLPMIPIDERYASSPVLEDRVAGFPDDDDPIYLNSMYADSFVTLLLYRGVLKPAE